MKETWKTPHHGKACRRHKPLAGLRALFCTHSMLSESRPHMTFSSISISVSIYKRQAFKNPRAIQETWSSIPGSLRSAGGGNGNPLQYSSLKNLMNRETWRAVVHGVARVGYDLVTKPPPLTVKDNLFRQHA